MARPPLNRKCEVDGCDRKHYGHGYCSLHYRRVIIKGLPADQDYFPRRPKEIVEYRGAHRRVEIARGKARIYFCVDCPNQAQEWSLSPSATDVLISNAPSSAGKAYSLDIFAYEPRCCHCHRLLDGESV